MSETPTALANEHESSKSPLSYAGSAERIFSLRRRVSSPAARAVVTAVAAVLLIPAWVFVTGRYLLAAVWRGQQAERDAEYVHAAVRAGRVPDLLPPEEERDRL